MFNTILKQSQPSQVKLYKLIMDSIQLFNWIPNELFKTQIWFGFAPVIDLLDLLHWNFNICQGEDVVINFTAPLHTNSVVA